MSTKRRYEMKARAEKAAETRRRIVEATVALHEEVGPARTTVAEVLTSLPGPSISTAFSRIFSASALISNEIVP